MGPSIEYLELYALTVGVLLWSYKFSNKRIAIFCDNMSVVHMVNSMSSSCKNYMVLIRMITLECMCRNVRISAMHVASGGNEIADSLSRLDFDRFHDLTDGMNFSDFPEGISDAVWPISKIWLAN